MARTKPNHYVQWHAEQKAYEKETRAIKKLMKPANMEHMTALALEQLQGRLHRHDLEKARLHAQTVARHRETAAALKADREERHRQIMRHRRELEEKERDARKPKPKPDVIDLTGDGRGHKLKDWEREWLRKTEAEIKAEDEKHAKRVKNVKTRVEDEFWPGMPPAKYRSPTFASLRLVQDMLKSGLKFKKKHKGVFIHYH